MNCDTCGTTTTLRQSDCVCCTNCNNPTSDSTSSLQQQQQQESSSSSTTTSLNLPYRGRRWMLRRANARNKQDSSPTSSSTSSSSSSPSAPLSDLDDRKFVHTSNIPVNVDVEIGTILSEIPDGPCEFPNPLNIDHSQDPHNIDVDVDLDAQSMVVSAAQSETASTISRAAFSISDRTDNDPREHVSSLIDSQQSTDDHHHQQPIQNIEKQPLSTKNVKQRVQAAYFRELMLSSLRL